FLHPHPVADFFCRGILPVGNPELCRKILVQTAAKGYIDNLQPPADPEDRDGVTESLFYQENFPSIPVPVYTVQGKESFLSVKSRVRITPAAEEKPVADCGRQPLPHCQCR